MWATYAQEAWNYEFNHNNDFQAQQRDRYLVPFYQYYALGSRFLFLERFTEKGERKPIEKEYDTVVQKRDGIERVEEKIARWSDKIGKRDRFLLETDSCTNPGHESKGWMHNTKPNKLLYAFQMKESGLDIYLIDFQRLKTWFWRVYESYDPWIQPGYNRTRCWQVPIVDVLGAIPTAHYIVEPDLRVRQVPIEKGLSA